MSSRRTPAAALFLTLLLVLAGGLALPQAAAAQTRDRDPLADATLLNLSESAERDVTPDTMRARLMAQASAEDAAAAQNTVNAAMTKALAMVRTLGLEVETGGYNTFQDTRSEEHTSELQSLMRISYAVFCLKKKKI